MPLVGLIFGIFAIGMAIAIIGPVIGFILVYVIPTLAVGGVIFAIGWFLYHEHKAERSKIDYPQPEPRPQDYIAKRIAILKSIEERTGLTDEQKTELTQLEAQ